MKVPLKKLGQTLAHKLSEKGADKASILKDTATLLFKTGNTSKLNTVMKSFIKEWNEVNNEVDVCISAPDESFVKFPKELKGKKVHLKVKKDESLIAGVEIKIKDYILKDSVKSRLYSIKNISN